MTLAFPHDDFLADDFFGRDAIWSPGVDGAIADMVIPGAYTEPGQDGAYTAGSGAIRVILTIGPGNPLNLGGQINMQVPDITVGCKAWDVPGVKIKSTISVEGTIYTVSGGLTPDETGWLDLQAVRAI
jgi:hypothetical protein